MILAIMATEYVWLVRRSRWAAGEAALRLLPGALMVVALRAALVDADWWLVALPLALSFPIHRADLRRRGGRQIT